MLIQYLNTAPELAEFTPLQEHQQQTPVTFFGAKPVLYAHHSGLTLSAVASQLEEHPVFSKFNIERDGAEALVKNVDIFVSSADLMLFQQSPSPAGVLIPYPAVGLHATMKYKSTTEALYMNISLNDFNTVENEEDLQVLELTLLPPSYTSNPDSACIGEIYAAMNICADLHPDSNASEDEGDSILDDSAPGASGWITAENMDEYIDEHGNFKGTVFEGEDLGPGAGTVRQREGDEEANGLNGVDGHEEKYHRTG